MKKVIVFLLLLWSVSSFSQNRIYVGGEVGLSYYEKSDISSIRITPLVGYELNSKWDIGAYIGYSYMQDNNGDKSSYSFSLAPFARYNFSEKGLFRLFIEGGAGYSYSDMEFSVVKHDKRNGFEVGLKPGFTVKLHDNIRFSAKFAFIGYRKNYLAYENGYFGNLSLNNLDLGLIVNL